ncbi:MAG: DVUA0089 family protein, partial [Pirellulales bacterium]
MDTVVELVDANGRILALSDNSGSEETLGSITYRDTDLSADSVHPMRKSAAQLYPTDSRGNPRDLYSTNPKDAGFRVVLPGQSNISTLYHVRVRSSNIGPGDAVSKLSDPAEVRSGKSSGVYQMQIRLGETDEIPGSSFNYADVRYAVNGLTLSGVPRHSPLVGETSEQESRDTNADGTVDVPNNDAFARAQELGNILATDRATISVAGSLSSPTDVDWYSFTIDYQLLLTPLAEYLSTVFDIDYADGIGRPDTSMYLFDSNGRLVSLGLNSNILDDRAGPLRGADNGDLSRGSSGTLDAYLGSIELPAGRYFLAVTNSGNVPAALAGFTSAGATNPLVRLQPASNTQLIVEDHVGSDGGSTATAPIVPQFVDSNSVVQWTLGDIPLYVSRDTGLNSTDVYIVNPFTGQVSNNVTVGGRIGLDIRDIAFRANGTLQAFDTSLETLITGDRDPLSRYISIDYGTGATTIVGNSGIETYHPGATAGTTVDSNSGMTIEALTIATLNNAEVGFFVANRDLGPQATDYNDNIVYRFNTATGTAVSVNTDRVVVNNFDQKLLGAGTQITEVGRISTSTPAGVSRRLVVTEATLVNGSSTNRLLLDGARFTIRDSANFPATFEFNSGPELLLNYNQYTGRIMRDGDVFTIDGVNYEFDTGGTLVISAATGAGIADGSTVSITDILGVTKTFEFDSNNSLVNPANIPVAYTAASTQAQLTSALVSAINSAGFASVASVNPGSNRISVANKSTSVNMTVTGLGLLIDGTRGVAVGNQRIAITETMTQAQFVDAIRSAMPSTIIVGHDGSRVNFSGAMTGSFASFAARGVGTDLGTSGGVTAGNLPINFLAEDTQETIAIRVAAAINGAAIAGVSAVANGRDVNLSNATIDTTPARAPSSPMKVGDIAPGGRITGV